MQSDEGNPLVSRTEPLPHVVAEQRWQTQMLIRIEITCRR